MDKIAVRRRLFVRPCDSGTKELLGRKQGWAFRLGQWNVGLTQQDKA